MSEKMEILKPHQIPVEGELIDMLARAKYNEALSIGWDLCQNKLQSQLDEAVEVIKYCYDNEHLSNVDYIRALQIKCLEFLNKLESEK